MRDLISPPARGSNPVFLVDSAPPPHSTYPKCEYQKPEEQTPKSHTLLLMTKILHSLADLKLWELYGIFLMMGTAGFVPSTLNPKSCTLDPKQKRVEAPSPPK